MTFELARQQRLLFYDAAYLAVAPRNRIPIVTLDQAIQSAAQAAGILLLD
jgi:predicted nucleic acid-binding protein